MIDSPPVISRASTARHGTPTSYEGDLHSDAVVNDTHWGGARSVAESDMNLAVLGGGGADDRGSLVSDDAIVKKLDGLGDSVI